MKNKLLCFSLVLLATGGSLFAQNFNGSYNFVAKGTQGPGTSFANTGITAFAVSWAPTNTVATCALQVDSSADNITWGNGDLIASQNCAVAGSVAYATLASGKNFVRVNVTSIVGNGGVNVTLTGSSGSGSTSSGWHRLGTIIGSSVPGDQGNVTESRTILDTNCPLLPNLLAGETCFRTWGAVGWTSGGVALWEAPTADPFAQVRSATVTPSNYAHISVSKCGSTYYLTAAGPISGPSHIDLFSSATGNQDWALLQANVVTLGAGGQFDAVNTDNSFLACAGTLDGTSNVYLYYDGQSAGSKWQEGMATCSSNCFGGSATWTKSASNPILTESQSVGGCEARLLNSVVVLRCHGEVTGSGVLPSDLVPLYKSASPTGPFARTTSTLDMQRATFDEGVLNNVGQIQKPTTIDLNGYCYLFYNADEDGSQQAGAAHTKMAMAYQSCAAMALTNGGSVEPDRLNGQEWATVNTAFVAPTPGLAIGYGTAAQPPGPQLFLQDTLSAGNVSFALVGNNCWFTPVTGAFQRISSTYGCGGLQINSAQSNVSTSAQIFLSNIAGTKITAFADLFDASNNILEEHDAPITSGGTAVTLSGTGACATTTCVLTITSVTQNDVFVFHGHGF